MRVAEGQPVSVELDFEMCKEALLSGTSEVVRVGSSCEVRLVKSRRVNNNEDEITLTTEKLIEALKSSY